MPEEVFPFLVPTGLKLDQQTLGFLLDAIPHLLWITDAQGYLLYANTQAFHSIGLAHGDLHGFLWSQIIHPRDRFSVLRAWRVALTTETKLYCEARLKQADGIYRWHSIRASAQRDAKGDIKLWIGTATEREYQEQQEQPLEVSDADFHALAETGPQMIWCSLADGTLIYCNQRYLAHVQAPFEELQGSGWQRFVHPEDVAPILLARQKAREVGEPYELEYRLKEGKTGTYRWFLRRVMPVFDTNGQIRRWFGLSTDIHEQKCAEEALRQSETRFRRLVESNIVGVTITDTTGIIHEANEAFLSLVGYSKEDVAAKRLRWTELTPPEYRERDAQALKILVTNGAFPPYEKAYTHKDGSLIPVAIAGALFRWRGTVPEWITLTADMRASKEVERQKDIFLALTSHELKTPLAALKGTLQLVERRIKPLITGSENLSPASRDVLHDCMKRLEGARRQVDIQAHLINDLLDISRLATQTFQLDLESRNLVQLVQETVENIRITVPERSLALCLPAQPSVMVQIDWERIRQVITNYITNALRYAPPDQLIQIGVTLQEKSIRVWVQDRGPGLTPEAQKDVWQLFHQIKGASGQRGSEKGLGLGLYLCQQLIAAHRGQVGVESAPGKGSTFWFQLPLL